MMKIVGAAGIAFLLSAGCSGADSASDLSSGGADSQAGAPGSGAGENRDARGDVVTAGQGGQSSGGAPPSGASAGAAPIAAPLAAVGPDRPMTCAWLDGDNCWKRMLETIKACAPNEPGQFSSDGSTCRFEDGAVFSWPGRAPLDALTYAGGQKLVSADGSVCMQLESVGWGDYVLQSGSSSLVYDALSWSSYRVICPDGSSYSSEPEGACPLAARGFAGTAPSSVVDCQQESTCSEVFGGGVNGFETVFVCNK
jgi:hypothetical protein